MERDADACKRFWEGYLSSLPPDHPHRAVSPDAFTFGDSAELADELAELVVRGRKRATASLAVEFTSLNEALPKAGDVSIILRGDRKPAAIVERTEVMAVPFESVGDVFAATEGEGDGSLAYWRAAHTEYFTRVCARLGGSFDAKTPVLCQEFKVIWPNSTSSSELRSGLPTTVWGLLAVYFVASLAHFVHNAEFIAFYPNLPVWLTRETVYVAWLAVTSVGVAGLIVLGLGLRALGVLFIGAYGAFGLDGLGHYTLALCSEHTLATNITIWSEAIAGLMLTMAAAALLGRSAHENF